MATTWSAMAERTLTGREFGRHRLRTCKRCHLCAGVGWSPICWRCWAQWTTYWPISIAEEERMLSPEERQEIEAEFLHYPTKQALSIDAMRIVQKHRGWVSDEALDDIGELLGMSGSDLDGVATFYNLIFRKPVGRHIVYLCDSVTCWIMGCQRLGNDLT